MPYGVGAPTRQQAGDGRLGLDVAGDALVVQAVGRGVIFLRWSPSEGIDSGATVRGALFGECALIDLLGHVRMSR